MILPTNLWFQIWQNILLAGTEVLANRWVLRRLELVSLHVTYLMAIGLHAFSEGAYMLADMLGVHIYYMAISWHAGSGGAYMSADTLGVRIYYMGQYAICGLKIYLGRDWQVCYMRHFGTYKNMLIASNID